MLMKLLLAGGAILLGSVCMLAAQQPGTNQGSSNVGSTQNDPTQGGSSATSAAPQSGAPQAGAIDQQPVDPTSATGRQAGRVGQDLDHHITECIVNGNREEIALARIAEQAPPIPR